METINHLLHSASGKQWQQIGPKQHHGINLPLFSLHSTSSCGIGEYPDLIPLIKWVKEIGFDIIQLLPLNDTGDQSGPYGALSAYALNPLHLGLAHLPFLEEGPDLKESLRAIQELTHCQKINYRELFPVREQFLKNYYQRFGARLRESQDYQSFVAENDWLAEYALFKTLKEQHAGACWEQWKQEFVSPSFEKFTELCCQMQEGLAYHTVIQFLCCQQMQQVKQSAEKHQVLLKGDIPILINRDSADVWAKRHLFQLDFSAGAPPDMYSVEGQNWGFPIYNWSTLKEEKFAWWIKRLQLHHKFYHLYRLDHIVGIFRIWAIPFGKEGNQGKFVPFESKDYIPQGEERLKAFVEQCEMLPIGEDLGSVPTDVRQTMSQLGVCGTKVIRWERKWNEDRRFIPYNEYQIDSMTTVSTHDSDTLQLWWTNSPQEAKDFSEFMGWEYLPYLDRERHYQIIRDSHHTSSLFHINLLQEYLALIPQMIWDNPEDERINVPGTISDNNWSYRFKPSVEEIISNATLKQVMQEILKA